MIPDNLKIYLFETDYLWTQIHPFPQTDNDEAKLTCNFDYEILFDETKRLYIDIGVVVNNIEIMFRSGIEFDGRNISWEEIFNTDFLSHPVEKAINYGYEAYFEFCEEQNLSYPHDLKATKSLIKSFTSSIIKQYTEYRSVSDNEHAYLINNVGLECVTGTDTILLFNATFTILNEILFTNSAFNAALNRESFGDIVPIPKYATIRYNCLQIKWDDVLLSFFDTILFHHMIDCAMQMLVGDKSEILKAALEKNGIAKEEQRLYIKLGTDLFTQLHEMLQQSNARIINLEEFIDWNRIIR